jgi:hypothetical protein
VKAKKGQLLILTLIVMAIGLIVISPLLRYLDSSYTQYLHELNRTNAYYTADAMMENILNDIYRGVDVYNQNVSAPYNLLNPLNGSGYLNSGYDIGVVINNSIPQSLDTPQGSSDWIYLDPGISTCNTSSCNTSLLLGSLGKDLTHDFQLYLIGGNQVQVNWAFDDEGVRYCYWLVFMFCSARCPYYVSGSMWMLDRDGVKIPLTERNGSAPESTPLHLWFNWSVPEGATGNYTIQFKNTGCHRYAVRDWLGSCLGDELRASYSEPFVAVDDTNYTWVRVGKEIEGVAYSYQDYMITATAKRNNQDIVSITALVRHSPGPMAWWKDQIVEIPGWQVTYY